MWRVKITIIPSLWVQIFICLIANYELQDYISSSPSRIQFKCYFVPSAITPGTSGFQSKNKRKEGKQNDISCTLYTYQKAKSRKRQRSLHEAENSCWTLPCCCWTILCVWVLLHTHAALYYFRLYRSFLGCNSNIFKHIAVDKVQHSKKWEGRNPHLYSE